MRTATHYPSAPLDRQLNVLGDAIEHHEHVQRSHSYTYSLSRCCTRRASMSPHQLTPSQTRATPANI